jgi:MoaA/NifB/PqqE/SkfB family radical SAM enzyme
MIERYHKWLRYKLNDRKHIMGLRMTATWKCNSRCSTCSIWKMEDSGEADLSIEEIDTFSRSPYLRHASYITISGGEPTLRKDLPDVFGVLHRNIPDAQFNMTTHGMDPDWTEELFRKTLEANPGIRFGRVGLSLNGPREIHDASRGIPGAFDKVVETLSRLQGLVPCAFSFTFFRENVDSFAWVQEFARSKNTFCYICWTVMNERFNVEDKDLVFWKPGMDKVLNDFVNGLPHCPSTFSGILKNLRYLPENIGKGYLYDHIVNREIMPCYAGRQIVHVLPNGDVYPCNFKMTPDRLLGNLRRDPFDRIWESLPPGILREIDRGDCMYPNGLCGDSDISPSVSNHPFALLGWYLKKLVGGGDFVRKRS